MVNIHPCTDAKRGIEMIDKYCEKCGHYDAIPYANTQCGCECHNEESE